MFKTKPLIQIYAKSLKLMRSYAAKADLKTYSQKKQHYGDLFPDKILNKKQKTPDCFYIANEDMAKQIDTHLSPYFEQSQCNTILELNPGVGYLTRKLLDREEQFKNILLMESMEHFIPNLQEMHTLYPERVKVQHGDLVNIWKLVYQDKMDNGSRVQELLRDIPLRSHQEGKMLKKMC